MSLLFDVDLNVMKKLVGSGGNLFRFETEDQIKFYYTGSNGTIYRTIISRPVDPNQYNLLLQSLPQSLRVVNVIEPHMLDTQILEVLNEMNLKIEELMSETAMAQQLEVPDEPSS